jgi:hypothetical protein
MILQAGEKKVFDVPGSYRIISASAPGVVDSTGVDIQSYTGIIVANFVETKNSKKQVINIENQNDFFRYSVMVYFIPEDREFDAQVVNDFTISKPADKLSLPPEFEPYLSQGGFFTDYSNTFDGNGYTITVNNSFPVSNPMQSCGLFASTSKDGIIKDTTFNYAGDSLPKCQNTGFIVGVNNGTMENIDVNIQNSVILNEIGGYQGDGNETFGLAAGTNNGNISNIDIMLGAGTSIGAPTDPIDDLTSVGGVIGENNGVAGGITLGSPVGSVHNQIYATNIQNFGGAIGQNNETADIYDIYVNNLDINFNNTLYTGGVIGNNLGEFAKVVADNISFFGSNPSAIDDATSSYLGGAIGGSGNKSYGQQLVASNIIIGTTENPISGVTIVGGAMGSLKNSLNTIEVNNIDVYAKGEKDIYTADELETIGGVIGTSTGNIKTANAENIEVYSQSYPIVGGMIGKMTNSIENLNVSNINLQVLDDAYQTNLAGDAQNTYVGGVFGQLNGNLIGAINKDGTTSTKIDQVNIIMNSTCRAANDEDPADMTGGNNFYTSIGGVAGTMASTINGATISNVGIELKSNNCDNNAVRLSVGGVVGEIQNNGAVKNTTVSSPDIMNNKTYDSYQG